MPETKIGRITHFFAKVNVAVVELSDGELAVGDTIHIKGHTTDHTQQVESLQIEHAAVPKIVKGQDAGMKVAVRVHEHDEVFKVT
jgi:putative protease